MYIYIYIYIYLHTHTYTYTYIIIIIIIMIIILMSTFIFTLAILGRRRGVGQPGPRLARGGVPGAACLPHEKRLTKTNKFTKSN